MLLGILCPNALGKHGSLRSNDRFKELDMVKTSDLNYLCNKNHLCLNQNGVQN